MSKKIHDGLNQTYILNQKLIHTSKKTIKIAEYLYNSSYTIYGTVDQTQKYLLKYLYQIYCNSSKYLFRNLIFIWDKYSTRSELGAEYEKVKININIAVFIVQIYFFK